MFYILRSFIQHDSSRIVRKSRRLCLSPFFVKGDRQDPVNRLALLGRGSCLDSFVLTVRFARLHYNTGEGAFETKLIICLKEIIRFVWNLLLAKTDYEYIILIAFYFHSFQMR